jgi:hypothetical protein
VHNFFARLYRDAEKLIITALDALWVLLWIFAIVGLVFAIWLSLWVTR